MPSPVGHALGAVAAGWLLQDPGSVRTDPKTAARATAAFALLGMAPDLNLFLEVHRGATHSLGAALLVGVLAWVVTRQRLTHARRFAAACAGAYGSHVLLDWLGSDSSPPIGVVALWPLSATYYESPWHLFFAVSRRFSEPAVFFRANLAALGRELLILVPVLLVVRYTRRRRPLPIR